jgi:hypothetical protein
MTASDGDPFRPVVSPEENLRAILESPSYTLAEEDLEFLKRDALRPARLQLELLKPEMTFQEQNVHSTIVVFGGTRIVNEERARERLAHWEEQHRRNPGDEETARRLRVARRVLDKARYYEVAREFGRIVSTRCQREGLKEWVVVTGGGPGIMEAANRGAFEVGAKSIGLNITIPHEQVPNPYITPELCFQFHYFALRKMHFLMRARAMVAFPGGFGTMDELFETLTLIQTGKIHGIPIILVGKEFWTRLVDWDFFVEEGTIDVKDLGLFRFAETAEEIWTRIERFYDGDVPTA